MKMKTKTWTRLLLIPLALVCIDVACAAWRMSKPAASRAPLFSWQHGQLISEGKGSFGKALQTYRADRGTEDLLPLPDDRQIKLFYFEWDDLEAGPFSALAGHESEVCNLAAGFKVLESGIPRQVTASSGVSLDFHMTKLATPAGSIVYVYKLPWIQGLGAWQIDSSRQRSLRLTRAFTRHRGAARVIQAGVFGAATEQEAWDLVKSHIVTQLNWSTPGQQ